MVKEIDKDRGLLTKLGDRWYMWRYKKIKDKCEDRDSLKLQIIATKHKLITRYVPPQTSRYAWDLDTYYNGNLFVSGKANPINIPTNTNNEKLFESSQKYRSFMQNKFISDIMSSGQKSKIESLMWMIIAVSVPTLIAVIWLALNIMGVV